MSWFSISLPNPFKFQESDEDNLKEETVSEEEEESSSHGGGVKEDLSELGQTIGRQLWGVASFLAPPPVTVTASDPSVSSSSQTLLGIRSDFAEISGSFKSGFSLLSPNKAVNQISRLASNLLLLEKEEDSGNDGNESLAEDPPGGGIVGVTDEVLEFVREISMRPEFWMNFPLSLDDGNLMPFFLLLFLSVCSSLNYFDISDAQREHASTVECLAPSLAALRLRICPNYMNDGHFWMVVEARELLLQKLQNRPNTLVENSKTDDLFVEVTSKGSSNIEEDNNQVQEKEVLAETVNSAQQVHIDEQKNIEQWLEEEDIITGTSFDSPKQLGNEEDVSFSDLEDDDDDVSSRQPGLRPVQDTGISPPNRSNDWVQLSETETQSNRKKAVQPISRAKDSEGEESNDWLTVDDFDSDSLGNV
ncbi:hypothetical protein HHK36_021393 [Tetracentron sinense]|uniref:BSD domain-containing protein n=1 Tax=Tetracentron sinense TaxID=13715 RepID=A0A835D9V6_TETSI|nr:hypothetical protein HHK36_021393 [Tetracentron sinense]